MAEVWRFSFELTGQELSTLLELGVEYFLFSTSDNHEYRGHLCAVYFFNCINKEVAHITGASSVLQVHSRDWGNRAANIRIGGDSYYKCREFKPRLILEERGPDINFLNVPI